MRLKGHVKFIDEFERFQGTKVFLVGISLSVVSIGLHILLNFIEYIAGVIFPENLFFSIVGFLFWFVKTLIVVIATEYITWLLIGFKKFSFPVIENAFCFCCIAYIVAMFTGIALIQFEVKNMTMLIDPVICFIIPCKLLHYIVANRNRLIALYLGKVYYGD